MIKTTATVKIVMKDVVGVVVVVGVPVVGHAHGVGAPMPVAVVPGKITIQISRHQGISIAFGGSGSTTGKFEMKF